MLRSTFAQYYAVWGGLGSVLELGRTRIPEFQRAAHGLFPPLYAWLQARRRPI